MRGVASIAHIFSSPERSSGEGDRAAVEGAEGGRAFVIAPSVLPRGARQSTSPPLRPGEERGAA
jgi:hypothetical protein